MTRNRPSDLSRTAGATRGVGVDTLPVRKKKRLHGPFRAFSWGHENASKISIGTRNAREARETSRQYTHIIACCNGRAKTAGGYRWKYKE